jgi:hypothetical protein
MLAHARLHMQWNSGSSTINAEGHENTKADNSQCTTLKAYARFGLACMGGESRNINAEEDDNAREEDLWCPIVLKLHTAGYQVETKNTEKKQLHLPGNRGGMSWQEAKY